MVREYIRNVGERNAELGIRWVREGSKLMPFSTVV